MKKAVMTLLYIGLAGTVIHALLLTFGWRADNIFFFIADICLFLGIVLFPFLLSGKFKKRRPVQKILLAVFWVAIILIGFASLTRYMGFDREQTGYFFKAGFCLILLCILFALALRIVYKLRRKPIGKLAPAETLGQWDLTEADINQYEGVYVNEKLPLKITITKEAGTLIAQATDQNAFYLEVIGKNTFKYPKRDIMLEFDLTKNELILRQHGGYFYFLKEV